MSIVDWLIFTTIGSKRPAEVFSLRIAEMSEILWLVENLAGVNIDDLSYHLALHSGNEAW